MSGELSEGLQELWDLYRAALREAHLQGLSELLRSKDTIQELTLETGQKILVAYDRNSSGTQAVAGENGDGSDV